MPPVRSIASHASPQTNAATAPFSRSASACTCALRSSLVWCRCLVPTEPGWLAKPCPTRTPRRGPARLLVSTNRTLTYDVLGGLLPADVEARDAAELARTLREIDELDTDPP